MLTKYITDENDNQYELLFETVRGSTIHGTNSENSDTDYIGVFMQPIHLRRIEHIRNNKDEIYYELEYYIDLLIKSDPGALEMLYIDKKHHLYCHPAFQILIDNRDKLLTKDCFTTFSGMAYSMIKKSRNTAKMVNWSETDKKRLLPIDFCTVWLGNQFMFTKLIVNKFKKLFGIYYDEYSGTMSLTEFLKMKNLKEEYCGLVHLDKMKDCFSLYYSVNKSYRGLCFETSNHLRLSSIPKGEIPLCILQYNESAYSNHCKRHKEYLEWERNHNKDRIIETNTIGQKIDAKSKQHCVRLIETAEDIIEYNTLKVFRENNEYLKNIRKGNFNLEELITDYKDRLTLLKEKFEQSNLPDKVDRQYFKNLQKQIQTIFLNNQTI